MSEFTKEEDTVFNYHSFQTSTSYGNNKATTTTSPKHLSRTYSTIGAKNKEQICLKPEITFQINKSNS